MNVPADASDAQALAEFLREAERVRSSGVLGRSLQLQRLFDFLVGCRTTGRVPKEVEVAIDCFERSPDAGGSQDATVRVTAHKLRRRLEEFYRDAGEPARLTIPRGEYRLALAPAGPPAGAGAAGQAGAAAADPAGAAVPAGGAAPSTADAPASPGATGWRRLLPATGRERFAALVAVAALALAALVLLRDARRPPDPVRPLAAVRASALWTPVLADALPVQLVLGDYFILGERDERGEIRRLVREFDINSGQQLRQRAQLDPAGAARYADMNLGYLPTSSASALREVLPVVMASGKPVMLTLASELDPATLKSTHAVYLGYLSGLGMMEDLMSSASRYSLGGSYDELIDSVTGAARISEAGEAHPPGQRYRDYAYIAALAGPGGHTHLLIAGTRDVGLMHAAEVAADATRLQQLGARLGGEGAFEALYEVQGLNGINVQGELLEASLIEPPR